MADVDWKNCLKFDIGEMVVSWLRFDFYTARTRACRRFFVVGNEA
jgi:hypothetical protein